MNGDGPDDLTAARRAAKDRGDFSLLRQRVPYAGFLDVQVTLQEGQPHFRLPYRASLIGNTALPALHGGVVAGFMENAALLHLLLLLDETRVPKSIDFSIDYLRSANAVDTYARCEVARLGRRVAQVQIRCWQGGDRDTAPRSPPKDENERVRERAQNPASDRLDKTFEGLIVPARALETNAGLGHEGRTRDVALARAHFLLGDSADPE